MNPEFRLAFDVAPEEIVATVAGSWIATRDNEKEHLTKVQIGEGLGAILYFHPARELLVLLPTYLGSKSPLGLDMGETAIKMGGGCISLFSRVRPGIECGRDDLVIAVSMGSRRFTYNVCSEDACDGETLKALEFIDRVSNRRTN